MYFKYLTLLRSIGVLLDIREMDGLRSMGNLPPEERQRLINERTKSIEIICNKISVSIFLECNKFDFLQGKFFKNKYFF
jgi:hypothetical protein